MKINEFWNQFDIRGESLMVILRILKKPENKELPQNEKFNIIKNIYYQKVKKDQDFINEQQIKLNKINFKLNVENNRLVKRKTEQKFFKCEDNIQNYEEYSEKLKQTIKSKLPELEKNKIILDKLKKYKI